MEKSILKSGIRVLLDPMTDKESLSIGLMIRTGSKYESKINNGVSHFIEHLLVKSTNKEGVEIYDYLDSIGGNINAYTSKEHTVYYVKVLEKHYKETIRLMFNMIFNPEFDDNIIETEKNIIIREINLSKDNLAEQTKLGSYRLSFGDHPIAYDILGSSENIRSLNKKDIVEYYNKFYFPENIVLSLSGKISNDVIDFLNNEFNYFSNSKNVEKIITPKFQGGLKVSLGNTHQAHFCMSFQSVSRKDELSKLFSFLIFNAILGKGRSSMLFKKIREKNGLAYNIYTYPLFYEDIGLLNIYAATSNEDIDELYNSITHLLVELKKNGISVFDFEKAKTQIKSEIAFGLENTIDRMFFFGQNEVLDGQKYDLSTAFQIIDEITFLEVNKLIDNLLTGEYSLSIISSNNNPPSNYDSKIFYN